MSLSSVLDFVLGGRRSVDDNLPSIDDTRVLQLTDDNALTFQAPDMSAGAMFAARVGSRLGNNSGIGRDLTTRKSTLELDDSQITRGADGTLEINFEQFGGQQFKGTLEELGKLQGTALMDVIGAGAVDTASGNTLPNNVVQGSRVQTGNGVTKTSVTNGLVPKVKTTAAANGADKATTKPTSFLELSDFDSTFDNALAERLDTTLDATDRDSLLETILNRAQGAVDSSRTSTIGGNN